MSHLHRDKRDRDYDDRRGVIRSDRDRDSRRSAPDNDRRPEKKRGANLNEFFVDGEGIEREVLQKEICRFLGPEALCKPARFNDVDGYSIKAVRTFTPEMLADLMHLSKNYVSESREMARKGHRGLTYGESETSRRQDTSARSDSDDGYSDRSRFPSGPSYPIDPPQPGGYPVSSQFSSGQAYPALAYPAGNSLPLQSSPYPGPSSYGQQMPSYPISARSGPGESHYVYGHDYMAPQDPYGRSSTGHPQAPPREMPMVMDPYYGNPRMDKRDLRPDPRADSRYPPQYMQSPADDVPMGGMDGIRYGDYPPAPPMQNGRGYPVQNTRAPQVGYDRDRNSPGLQYRHEIPREEQRRRDRDRR